MERQLALVRRRPSLGFARSGIFGHFCGLDHIHVCLCSDMRRRGLVSSWSLVVTDGLVCVQQEHTQPELCQASSEPHHSLVRTCLTSHVTRTVVDVVFTPAPQSAHLTTEMVRHPAVSGEWLSL